MKIALAITLPLLLAVCFAIDAMHSHEAREDARQRDWVSFSMQHHCRVVREPGFFDSSATWQCDGGFQIRRYE